MKVPLFVGHMADYDRRLQYAASPSGQEVKGLSLSTHPILRAFRSFDTVLSAARSCITCANAPVELHASKNAEDSLMDMNGFELAYQQSGYKQIAGIDEAGRGALAGPVIAAACYPTH